MIHCDGNFHSDYGLGTAARLAQRAHLAQVAIISMVAVADVVKADVTNDRKKGPLSLDRHRVAKTVRWDHGGVGETLGDSADSRRPSCNLEPSRRDRLTLLASCHPRPMNVFLELRRRPICASPSVLRRQFGRESQAMDRDARSAIVRAGIRPVFAFGVAHLLDPVAVAVNALSQAIWYKAVE